MRSSILLASIAQVVNSYRLMTLGSKVLTLKGHDYQIFSLAVEGPLLFSGDGHGYIKVWDTSTGKCL